MRPELLKAGFVERYTVCCGEEFGHKRYRLAFAIPRARFAVENSRADATKLRTLRALGWTVIRMDTLQNEAASTAQGARLEGPEGYR